MQYERGSTVDPRTMFSVPGLDDLQPVADEASDHLQAVLDTLI
jgi:hypothetical protein